MSNILTPERKKARDRLMRARFVMLLGIVITCMSLVAVLALVPSYISIRIAQAALETDADAELPPEAKEDQNIASQMNALVKAITPVANATSSASTALASALAVRPTGASITQISYIPGTIVLTGNAARRELVNEYRAALESSGAFSSVTIPVAALVGAQEGKFTVTLKGAF